MPGIVSERLFEVEVQLPAPAQHSPQFQVVGADSGAPLEAGGQTVAAFPELAAVLCRRFRRGGHRQQKG